jgi:hypothetical protein
MIEHLPLVRFVARRIHERLPQHVPIEDLYSAGVVGLLEANDRFDPAKGSNSAVMRNFVSVAPFSTVCGRSTGVRGIYGVRRGRFSRRSKSWRLDLAVRLAILKSLRNFTSIWPPIGSYWPNGRGLKSAR